MRSVDRRWTAAALMSLGGLTIASFLLHGESGKGRAPVRPILRLESHGDLSEPKPAPVSDPVLAAAPPPVHLVEHRSAREEGYREAREAVWEGPLAGQVLSSEGPLANLAVRVEWVVALQPDPKDIAQLKRGGAHRDRDGTWWARMLVQTDDSGFFQFEGLPAVPLRLHAGRVTQQAQVGGFSQIWTEPP